MSIQKIRPIPGQPIILRKGKPLTQGTCPLCEGATVEVVDAHGQKIQKCTRCRAEVTSTKF
jgi:hypothetical protein